MDLQKLTNSTIALSCCIATTGLAGCNKGEVSKPNIILVMADDQGWGDMGYYGHPVLKTPSFDESAKTGLCFNRFYAAAPVSSPTRGSVLTGRHPNRYGVFTYGRSIRPQEITIAETLKTAGYVTGHFGKWHLGPVYKDSPVNPGASGFDEWFSSPNFYDNNPVLSREGIAVQTYGESSMVTVDAAIEFIRKHSKGSQPFFTVIWFGSPHLPWQASEEDRDLYADQDEQHKNYYGEITGMDRAYGKLRQELKSLGIAENTLLWFCSDNGGFKNVSISGGREFKASIYEGGLRVPSIIEWPAVIKDPRITAFPCTTCDIYPTLLDIAGVKPEEQYPLDGISIFKLITGKMDKRPVPIGFWKYPDGGKIVPSNEIMLELLHNQQKGIMKVDSSKLDLDAGEIIIQYPTDIFPGHAAWLDWPYKFHRINLKDNEVRFELYNLEDDPGEKNDLSERNPEIVNLMEVQVETWMKSVINSLNGADYKK